MTDLPRRAPATRVGTTPAGRRQLRRTLTTAAIDLFLANGYEATTVDEIAAAAGVGRRTFFRYFGAKEDVIFANHDEIVAEMELVFDAADPAREPVEVACAAVGLVLDYYVADLEISVKRFALTRTVPTLRDKEVATVDRYQRVLARYLQRRFAEQDDELAGTRAAIAAAAIAAANNHVLRRWLRSGGKDEIAGSAEQAFALVIDAFRGRDSSRPAAAATGSGDGVADTVVAVMTTATPLHEVVRQVSAALRGADR
jgi:AcrR family transcriptional regulator